MSDPQPKQSRLPSVDPGLASIVAAVLTLIGVIVTVVVQRDPGPATTPAPVAAVVETATVEPTATPEPTATSEPTATATLTPPTATPVPLTPTQAPQIVSQLPANQAEAVRAGAASLLQVGRSLPLMVRDDFETQDYGWLESQEVIQGGGECDLRIEDGAYRIDLRSATGAIWCTGGLPRQAADFQMTTDLTLAESQIADIYVLYRMSPDQRSYYSIGLNPATQVFWVNVVADGEDIPLVPRTVAEHIERDGTNTISLVATGPAHALYFNDQLDVLFVDERLATGTFGVSLTLQESNSAETLIVDNFELRGN